MKETGGPAFPCGIDVMKADEGMTLRDWFAGQALAGFISQIDERVYTTKNPGEPGEYAKWKSGIAAADAKYCYSIADAMIGERSK